MNASVHVVRRLMIPLVRGLAILLVLPIWISFQASGLCLGKDAALENHSQWLAFVPGRLGMALRAAFFRLVLERCHPSVQICFGCLLSKVGARLEANTYIGPYSQLGLVTIEKDTLLGPQVQVLSGPHSHGFERLDVPIRMQPGTLHRVTIGEDCWIGAGAIIMADVESQSVVAAGSIVTKKVPRYSVVAGNPAKSIRSREIQQNSTNALYPLEEDLPHPPS